MNTEMGEYLVGAYLKLVEECDVVDYNVREPGGGLAGPNELDVVGFRFHDKAAFMCEVTTHVRGLLIGASTAETVKKVHEKLKKQQDYAEKHFSGFDHKYMFWSPNVPKGRLFHQLNNIDDRLQLVVNGEYKAAIEKLKEKARQAKQPTQNPAFRLLQILESMRD